MFGEQNINFLNKQFDRMNISDDQRQGYMDNMYKFSQNVRNIESDNNPLAAAGTTSAKGVYQFTDDSVNTGMNRMKNMGFGEDAISGISQNPAEWDDEQADSMFLANMFAQKGSDDLLGKIGGGDAQAMQDAYYKFHHTAPDEATINRVNKMMPAGEVDSTMNDYAQTEDAFSSPEENTPERGYSADFWNKDWLA